MPRKDAVQNQCMFVPKSARHNCYFCGRQGAILNHCRLCFHMFCPTCWGDEIPLPEAFGSGTAAQPVCVSCTLLVVSFSATFLCGTATGNGAQILFPGSFLGVERRIKKKSLWRMLTSPCHVGGSSEDMPEFDAFPHTEITLVAWRPLNKQTAIAIGSALDIPLSRVTAVSIEQRCRCLITFTVEREPNSKREPLKVVLCVSVGECDQGGCFMPEPKSTQAFAGTLSAILEHFQRHKINSMKSRTLCRILFCGAALYLLLFVTYVGRRSIEKSPIALPVVNNVTSLVPCQCTSGTSMSYHACVQSSDSVVVPGMAYVPSYLTRKEQSDLLAEVNKWPFQPYVGKSVQEFGFTKSFYAARPTSPTLPPFLAKLAQRLKDDGIMPHVAGYVLVNRYAPGEGIHPHVDDPMYVDGVASVSLESPAVFHFFRKENTLECGALILAPGSAFSMAGEARYQWKHEMVPVTSELWEGRVVQRTQRTAVTFRSLVDDTLNNRKSPGDLIREWRTQGRD